MRDWKNLAVSHAKKARFALPYMRDGIRLEIDMMRRMSRIGSPLGDTTKARFRAMWSAYRYAMSQANIMKGIAQ